MDMQDWMERFRNTVLKIFGRRIVCIGLQGSRGRGEATETSDIDAVVILDRLDADDLPLTAAPFRPCRTVRCCAALFPAGQSLKTGIPPICFNSILIRSRYTAISNSSARG